MKIIAFAILGSAIAPVAASAAVADFETKVPFYCDSGNQTDSGLAFASSFAACFYGPADNADFPTPNTSVVMGVGYSDILVTMIGGDPFDLVSVDLAFGPFSHSGLESDTTFVTGNLVGGGTITTTLTIGYGFQTYNLGWTGLTSVNFGQLPSTEYIGFDNIVYNAAAIPEPASWAMMIAGFGLVGAAMRRRVALAA